MASPSPLPTTPSLSQPRFSALRTFLTRLTTTSRHLLSRRRPWTELLDRTSLSRPENLSEATSRIRRNFSYFKINYLVLISLLIAISFITHPFSLLLVISLLAAWIFLYLFKPSDQTISLSGRAFSDREILGILVVSTIVVVFLTSVGSLLISTLMIGLGLVCAHGAFRVPEDLFLDDVDPVSGGGLFSFIGGAATSAGVASV